MVLGPLLCLAALEAVLRLAGAGYPMSFFLPMKIGGKDCLVENDRFGWRFFGPERARAPFPLAIPKVKPPDTIRVFVFGESAAYGDPQPEFGLSRILQALLEGRFPGKHFEVVNTAMTAINSHVILPIARDCAARDGDFWVIYMGNNEVVGPFGSGTVFGAQAANLEVIRAGVAFKATRIGQELGNLARHLQNRPLNESEWGGMAMFMNNHIRQDDPRMATVYDSFGKNLSDIIDTGLGHGARVLVSTMARNLKDCGPFASDHRPGLSADDLARWQTLSDAGVQEGNAGKAGEALDSFEQAAKIDGTFAETHYREGQCAMALGRDADAAREFGLACDEDTLRFRADGRINSIIRRVAASRESKGALLIDSEAALSKQCSHGIAGGEFLYEHVHLNFEGNYLLARGFAEGIARSLPAGAESAWPTPVDCARRLGWNDLMRRKADMEILGRLGDAPFKEECDNRVQYQRLLQQIEHLDSAGLPEALRADEIQTKAAAEAAPGDWILQENLGNLQQQTGDPAGAAESLGHVAKLLPQSPEAWQTLGVALASAQRYDDALAAFQTALRLRPESAEAMTSMGEIYEHQGRGAEAAREFEEVLRLKPYWSQAHMGLGNALEKMGKKAEAKEQFQEAFKNRVRTTESFDALGKFAFGRGWYDAAVTNFSDSLRLNPLNPQTQVNLGLAEVKVGQRADAKAHFAEALRLQPDFAEAHFCMGLELGKDGDSPGAASEFGEAVRLKPDLVEAHLNFGIALSNEHLNQQALDQFDEVLRRDPSNQLARTYLKILRSKPAAGAQN
ncbi:MAG TPA: tetratricopeptide repeat protein [Verrucomicrobiae bacterium]|jgi:tetratricopeptide (TPR) repeat protein